MYMSCRQPLCFATLLLACTLFQSISSQTLPSALQIGIPTCAQPCVKEAIGQDFVPSICPNSTDFDCLCSHYGSDGYSLGERAFGCLYCGNCTSMNQTNATAVYTICDGQYNAVTPTHSTVVITVIQPTSTGETSISMGNPAMAAMATTSGPVMASGTLVQSTIQAAINTSPTTGASRSSGPIQLTEAQIAGIAIASIALVVLIVGIVGCLLFIRRRSKNLEAEDSKLLSHHSRNPSDSQNSHLGTPWKDPRGGPGGVGIIPLERPPRRDGQTPAQSERSWPRYYPIMPRDDIGLAQTTNVPLQMPASPTAPAMPINSQMPMPGVIPPPKGPSTPRSVITGPERPRSGHSAPQSVSDVMPVTTPPSMASSTPRNVKPAPEIPITGRGTPQQPPIPPVADTTASPTKRARRSIDQTAILSQVTEFEEDITSASISHLPRRPQSSPQQQQQRPPIQPIGQDQDRGRTPNRPAVPALRATSGSPRLRALRPSNLKIKIPSYPTNLVRPAETTVVTTSQPPQTQPQLFAFPAPPSKASVRGQHPLRITTTLEHPPPLYNQRSLPQAANHPRFANQAPQRLTPAQTAALVGRVPTAANLTKNRVVKASKGGSRRSQRSHPEANRDSMASFTSFESVGSEDGPTPPEDNKQQDAPAKGGSPISNLRYPKIPPSSSQSVSRSPPSSKNSDSPDKVSPPRMSPSTSSPRNKAKVSPPRGVADQLWRTEARQQDVPTRSSPFAVLSHEPQHKFQRGDSREQLAGSSQQPGRSSPPKPANDQSAQWIWKPDIDAEFYPKSPFGLMPKLTPTKQGEDLYLSVSRE